MEATAQQGAGEVRRLHIIYFISRKGRIEHPHLIRVHHLSRNGVRLRDIKRWLSGLRGKDMPESYAWSYKRRYKTGFVWQDLVDEDLITPVADNEYVLKGSEIPTVLSHNELSQFCDEKEDIKQREQPNCEAKFSDSKSSSKATSQEQESLTSMLTKPLLEIEEQSSSFSSDSSMSLTDDSPKLEQKNHSDSRKERRDHIFPEKEAIEEVERETFSEKAPFIPNFVNENKKKIHLNNFGKPKKPDPTPDQSSSKSKFAKSRSYSNNASSIFRNLLTCGTVDTKDSSMMVIKRKSSSSKPSNLDLSTYKGNQKMAQIRREDILGGSERVSRNLWHEPQENVHRKSCDGATHTKQKNKETNAQKPVPPAYRPRNGPNCSQCGKTFDPNQLHKHMISCKGMKALAKASAGTTAANTSYSHRRSTDSPRQTSNFKPLLD
ncbi:Protein UPSTREAM OF FLC [Heracleum sosnowskyi]|uniref:Protein UPSTREAM OF FLC n=1 Tax=Heracleum sosnowskyi TaxID=360622 RepID=A0AAD8JBM0_9APIA|nr:Protein UPSTREAM OF FLC [Heracleum sosnowskyi]